MPEQRLEGPARLPGLEPVPEEQRPAAEQEQRRAELLPVQRPGLVLQQLPLQGRHWSGRTQLPLAPGRLPTESLQDQWLQFPGQLGLWTRWDAA